MYLPSMSSEKYMVATIIFEILLDIYQLPYVNTLVLRW
jgi:hypothetical protein